MIYKDFKYPFWFKFFSLFVNVMWYGGVLWVAYVVTKGINSKYFIIKNLEIYICIVFVLSLGIVKQIEKKVKS